ncbi:hypothetical protein [Streptomyces sp. NPDC052701]
MTPLAREIHPLIGSDAPVPAARLLPEERPCPDGGGLLAHLHP